MAAPGPMNADTQLDDNEDWGADDAGDAGWGEDVDDGGEWGTEADMESALPAVASPVLTRQQSFLVLDNDSLTDKQEALIRQTAEVLFVTTEEAGCLLRHYGWKSKALQAEWFEDQPKIRATVGLTAEEDAVKVQRTPEGLIQCQSAYCDEVAVDQATALNCGHVFCHDCWQNYLTSQVSHGSACVFATCMGMKCNLDHVHKMGCACKEIIPSNLVTKFVTDSALTVKYRRWLLDSFVEGQRQIKWCPKAGCTLAVSYQSGGTKTIQCRCGHWFCFSCLEDSHQPAPCDIVAKWLHREKSDDATQIWLAARTKECPKCTVRIEKNKACNHMTCIKCGFHFCWLCKKPWDEHGSGSGGYYVCSFYDANVKEGKMSNEEKSNIANQKLLQKYEYYYKRYKSSWDGVSLTRKLGERLEKSMKNQDISKFAFVFEAIDKLMLARRCLQYTYALAYYFRAGGQKSLFEYQQDLLCGSTEALQDVMESTPDLDKLLALRKDVINKTSSIDKFRQEMNAQVERGEFEDLLLMEADTVQDRWVCVSCKTDNEQKRSHCSKSSCGACKLHGEPDCKSSACKVPSK